ncbi:hypothetical protein GBA52_010461 [Prunus armeniaca]|nr:hypothetical protein GBA52_010461 [Prunus armeniaca]
MVLDLWALSLQSCHLTMVDMVEAIIMGVLIGLVEVTIIGNDIEMMTATHMRAQRETQIMNPERTLITNLDQRKIHGFVRVATLMMKKMSKSDNLDHILTAGHRLMLQGISAIG